MTDAHIFVVDLADTWNIGSRLKLPDAAINANDYAVGVYGAHRAVPHPLGAVGASPTSPSFLSQPTAYAAPS